MTALKGADIERFVRKPDPRFRVILVYGPDAGLVHERSRAIARALVENPDDAFQLSRIDGDDLGSDTTRIFDEANTLGLFGGSRALWVRYGSKNIIAALESLFKESPLNPVVIEAGDLAPRHALRSAAESCAHAAALPCYADELRDLPRLIEEVLGEAGLKANEDARALIVASLGADRLLSRRELEKLALYAQGKSLVTAEDVEAVLSDASQLTSDMLTDAVFIGDATNADTLLTRSLREGMDAGVIIGGLLRHAILLSRSRLAMDKGQAIADVEKQARIFFKRSAAFRKQLMLWSSAALDTAIATLGEAQAAARRQASLSESTVSRACLTLALAARRAESQRR